MSKSRRYSRRRGQEPKGRLDREASLKAVDPEDVQRAPSGGTGAEETRINALITIRVENNDIKVPEVDCDIPLSVATMLTIFENCKKAVLSVPYNLEE